MRPIRLLAATATVICASISLAARAQLPSSAYDMDVVGRKLNGFLQLVQRFLFLLHFGEGDPEPEMRFR